MDTDVITKRLHISGVTPAITPADLSRRLSTFGTVKDVDGLGKLDALGQPKKFGYVTLEGTKGQLSKCVNVLSGSTWKGAKLRIGDAKLDYKERINKELAADPEPPRKKRKRAGGTEAPDMSLVTPTNVSERRGWKVTTMGRMIRPVRMRPEHPLPPMAQSALRRNAKKTGVKDGKGPDGKDGKEKKKRNREPEIRARRKTIDPTRWDSVHLKGMFLDVISAPREHEDKMVIAPSGVSPLVDETSASTNDSDSDEEKSDTSDEEEEITGGINDATPRPIVTPPLLTPASASTSAPAPSVATTSLPEHPRSKTSPLPQSNEPVDTNPDLTAEKQTSLSILHSLFHGKDDWVGQENVGSDIDEEDIERLKREGAVVGGVHREEVVVEEVPIDMDRAATATNVIYDDEMDVDEGEPNESEPVEASAKKPVQITKLKDLFAPREEEAGFSLLGHLNLDLELDDEIDIPNFDQPLPARSISEPIESSTQHISQAHPPSRTSQFTYDPTLPLFFPLPSTFSQSPQSYSHSQPHARQKDTFTFTLAPAAAASFHRTETENEIRKRWEDAKGELTREWKRRFREAGKSRRRRGGGDGD